MRTEITHIRPHFPMENHYVQSKNISFLTPKLACERVITNVACGNRHLCSIFICHFGVYFWENWKIIFKICLPKIEKNRFGVLTDTAMLTGCPSQWAHNKFLCVCPQNDLKLLKLPEEHEVSSSISRSDCSHFFQIKMHFMWLLISY